MWADAWRGVGVVAADRVLRALAVAQALAALSAGATSALLVVLVRSHLHASATGYGLAIGAGAFAGPLVLSRLPARDGDAPRQRPGSTGPLLDEGLDLLGELVFDLDVPRGLGHVDDEEEVRDQQRLEHRDAQVLQPLADPDADRVIARIA